MKEIVVISGKGGTGKTSIAASFAILGGSVVLADCDVDASDMHLVMSPDIIDQGQFSGGRIAEIRKDDCTGCADCSTRCRFDAVRQHNNVFIIDPVSCEGCGVCAHFCPANAIDFKEHVNGEWFVSNTRCGTMVHARLGIAEENSGKLVSLVRDKARTIANKQECEYVIIDGPPGIGCPVIASMANTDIVVIVTEPTLSAIHDFERVADVAAHFNVPAVVCINKYDINSVQTDRITEKCRARKLPLAGLIQYDECVTRAQIETKTIVEYSSGPIADEIRTLWNQVLTILNK